MNPITFVDGPAPLREHWQANKYRVQPILGYEFHNDSLGAFTEKLSCGHDGRTWLPSSDRDGAERRRCYECGRWVR